MGSGVIYAMIVAVWAVVLVPMFLKRHDRANAQRSADRFARAMRSLSRRPQMPGHRTVLMPRRSSEMQVTVTGPERTSGRARTAVAPAPIDPLEELLADARARSAAAARRRRRVLLVLVALAVLLAAVSALGRLPIWAPALPLLLALAMLVLGHRQVVSSRERTHRALRRLRADLNDAPTARRLRARHQPAIGDAPRAGGRSVQPAAAGTWDAVAAPLPRYVTQAAGMPRVIDLTQPGRWSASTMLDKVDELRRASAAPEVDLETPSAYLTQRSFTDAYVDDDPHTVEIPTVDPWLDRLVQERRVVNE